MKAGKKAKTYEMDMCSGPIFIKIVVFAVPLILSGILQLLFNAADIIVVGRFAGSESLAAVGSTSALINLLVNVFIGLSVGANVMVARFYGAGQQRDLEETVHTAMVMAAVGGAFLVLVGVVLADPLLTLMGTPDDVLPLSALYMKIFFVGMPVNLIYNFGSAILRAVGDTKRPLYFLLMAGIINVVLNLFFVIALSMGVAGVALATVISQCVSAFLIVRCLMKTDAGYRLELRKLRVVKNKARSIVKIGLPAGLQGAIFSVSNVLIQSSVNSFGAVAMAGNTAGSNVEGFVYTSMNAVHQTAVSFTGQNLGGRKFDRIRKIILECVILVTLIGLFMGNGVVLFGHQILGVYSSDEEVIAYGIQRLRVICTWYCLCGIMDVLVGCIRGLGYAVMPMIVSLMGACVFRIIWLYTFFAWSRSLHTLYVSYPVSWALAAAVHAVCLFIVQRRMEKKFG